MKRAKVIGKHPAVQVEFDGDVLLAGVNIAACEEYYMEHYSKKYVITWLSVL